MNSKSQKSKNDYVFTATRQEIMEMARKEHKWKIEGLAKSVLAMPSKARRRDFLAKFEQRHGEAITYELKDEILRLDAQNRKP